MSLSWEETLAELRRRVHEGGYSMSAHARKVGLSPAALSRILKGVTGEPHPSTQARIREYLQRLEVEGAGADATITTLRETRNATSTSEDVSPEEELLRYYLEHHAELATFMTLQAQELDAEDRRKVYFAGLNALKRAYIRAGEPIPDILFELERKMLAKQ